METEIRNTSTTVAGEHQRWFSWSPLDPNNFADVFGGPPRSVLSRQYSGELATSASLVFEDMFRRPNRYEGLGGRSVRTLPEFKIPASETGGGRWSEDELYSYIFGDSWRSRRSRSESRTNSNSKSRSNSSSILSSEELSPFRPTIGDGDDVSLSSFAAKIRPINESSKWNRPNKMGDYAHKFKGCISGFSKMVSSPETTTFGPCSYASVKESTEDMQVNSPASIVSSLNQDQGDETSTVHEEDDDEVMSSYIIEINPSKHRERIGESLGIDDAVLGELEKDENLCKQMKLELLDEDIKLWSDGKEADIRLLLSTLHHILLPSNGWIMIPLTNLKDIPNVKKLIKKLGYVCILINCNKAPQFYKNMWPRKRFRSCRMHGLLLYPKMFFCL